MVSELVKGELKWPVVECESCGFNLREATPKAAEKSNDASGRLKWTDFCPKCGHGMFVGDRVLPMPNEEELARREAAPVLAYVKEEVKAEGPPSGVPPDERGAALAIATDPENPDPEGQLSQEPKTNPEEKPEPGAIKPPGEGQYFCTKCTTNHNETSKLGKRHGKFKEA